MPNVAVLDHDAVLAAVSPREAIDRTRDAFLRHRRGEWQMPAKVYLEAPPHGDFRAMPALGDGLAILKWISSFPANPERDLPTVMGVLLVSDATTSEPIAMLDARSVTALRTGAVAPVAARALAREDAASVGIVGCGLHGAWGARCLAAGGYGARGCFHPPPPPAPCPPTATGPASAPTRGPRPPRRWPPSWGGRWAGARTRWTPTSSAA